MSHYSHHPEHAPRHTHDHYGHAHDHGRAPARHSKRPIRQQSRPGQNGYTIAHGGRQLRFGPVVFWVAVGSVVLMGGWSAATATYFAFRDDVLTRLVARQAQMQYAYEDRIAELRSKIDRTTSRQMLDQEQFSRKLDQIMRRQSMLESRAAALNSLPDVNVTGSIRPAARNMSFTEPAPAAPAAAKPAVINDTVTFVAPPDREARLESRGVAVAEVRNEPAISKQADDTLDRLQTSLDRVERKQFAILTAAEEHYETRARRMKGVFSDLGLNMANIRNVPARGGVGGPFVPVRIPANAGPFERQMQRVNISRAQADRLTAMLTVVPYRKPVAGPVEFSSGFGVRSDPFLGRPAMHTGLDFRASTGEPARATAIGRVVKAGWQGGYGKMVEIDHGNGLTTRYGHLSVISVKVGDNVRLGQTIGEVGSTGRSTGPHLHYETRINGEAVDPQRFLRAGVKLAAS